MARKKQGDSTSSPTGNTRRDKGQEAERLIALMKPLAELQGKSVFLKIPLDNNEGSRSCRLTTQKRQGEDARVWVSGEYYKQYQQSPLQETFNSACIAVQSAMLVTSGETVQESETPQKPVPQWKEKVECILDNAAIILPASEIKAQYAYVKPCPEKHTVSGVWRVSGASTIQLTDMYIEVERIAVPMATGKGKDWHVTLHCINSQGQEKRFEVAREDIEGEGLDAKVKGYAMWPNSPMQRYHLLEAINRLALHPDVIRQEEADSIGWQLSEQFGVVWQCSNGIETLHNGFILAEHSPFLPPVLLSPGNGYEGTNDLPSPNDEIWHLLLERLNPANGNRLYGKLGMQVYGELPVGSIADEQKDRAGKARFPIETIGEPRVGKSVEDNFVLSLQGIAFDYQRETYLQERNTAIGRIRLQCKVRHATYTDFDRKSSDNSARFEKEHQSRHDLLMMYNEGDGGTVGKRDGGDRSRGNPVGVPLLTGNYDHAVYSIGHDELADETRVMTFVWSKGVKSDDRVSREINARRRELYAWGVSRRKWLMRWASKPEHMSQFTRLVSHCYRTATDNVMSEKYEWKCDKHRNQTIECVAMINVFRHFLKAYHPGSFLIGWFEQQTPLFIQDRVERCQYVHRLDSEHKGEQGMKDFVLDVLRDTLSTGKLYLLSQQGKILTEDETPLSLTRYGLRLVVRGDEQVYDTGTVHAGYWLRGSNAIGFLPDVLYQKVKEEATRKRIPILPRDELMKHLVDEAVILPSLKKDEYESYAKVVKIQGKATRLVTVPHDVLYPACELQEGDTYIDEKGNELVASEMYIREEEEKEKGKLLPFRGKVVVTPSHDTEERAIVNGMPVSQAIQQVMYSQDGNDIVDAGF